MFADTQLLETPISTVMFIGSHLKETLISTRSTYLHHTKFYRFLSERDTNPLCELQLTIFLKLQPNGYTNPQIFSHLLINQQYFICSLVDLTPPYFLISSIPIRNIGFQNCIVVSLMLGLGLS